MFDFLKNKSEKIISISICVIIIAIIGVYAINMGKTGKVDSRTQGALEKLDDNREHISVKVDGKVNSPGEYKLVKGARVGDAIEAAGGFAKDANDKINVGIILKNGDKVTVVGKDEYANAGIDFKVNINTASSEELMQLDGVGEKLAARIIKYREDNGGFESTEEILKVKGIGKAFYEKMKEVITIEQKE